MFTTLHALLYPPLKGFSHRSDSHTYVYDLLYSKRPSKGTQIRNLLNKGLHKVDLLNSSSKSCNYLSLSQTVAEKG